MSHTCSFSEARVSAQHVLTQPPSQSVSPGQTVKLPCTASAGGSWYYFGWVRQLPGQRPQFVLYGSNKGEGIPDRFSGSSSGNPNYLTITNAQPEDEADYYCAAWEDNSKGSHSGWFCWGTETKTFHFFHFLKSRELAENVI
ncbi:Immunoglobulin lambda variable 1-40 [Varanus komodoensis]|nr:Immunoglobulin lambda variable 1-40 [Varanus komodoensis]